jgi:hypothetical protein
VFKNTKLGKLISHIFVFFLDSNPTLFVHTCAYYILVDILVSIPYYFDNIVVDILVGVPYYFDNIVVDIVVSVPYYFDNIVGDILVGVPYYFDNIVASFPYNIFDNVLSSVCDAQLSVPGIC